MNLPSDWLASEVDLEAMKAPKTSVATSIELQCVMEDEWPRNRVVRPAARIALEELPASQLLFGTDAPYEPRSVVEGQRFVRAIEDVTSNVDSKKILADNAIELLDR